MSKYGVFSGPYFPAFGLDMERYGVSVHVQAKCGQIRTRKNSVFEHFSRSELGLASATHVMPLVSFYTTWKRQKTRGVSYFKGLQEF